MKHSKPANDNVVPQLDPLMRLTTVINAVGLSSSSIYRMMDAGDFPRPLKLGPNSVRWRTSSIVGWVNELKDHHAQAA